MQRQEMFEEESNATKELLTMGEILDMCPLSLGGDVTMTKLAQKYLRVRTREGFTAALAANPVQQRFEQRRGRHNIVLKARQLGLTTWTAGRFFLKTITHPGTLTLQVAHTQEAAEEIFRIVHRFLVFLPDFYRNQPLRTSRANSRQIVFPQFDSQYRVVTAGDRNAGRGLTVQNLHCSELARWPGDPAEILAGLRAALAPGAETILESTPNGVGGCFYEEWRKAAETGMVRHFFPWWLEEGYRAEPVEEFSLSDEERELRARANLDLAQIGFRRRIRASFTGLAGQEYAEDAESCFLASGESIFELAAVDARLADAPEPTEMRRNGELEIWLPVRPGRRYIMAVDPAGGGANGDYSAVQVVDMETGMQCAEFAGHLGGQDLAEFVCCLAREFNKALVVVERNNHGGSLLALLELVWRYPAIYHQNGQSGWLTTSSTRPAALSGLNAALVDSPQCFMSRRLLAECRSFVRRADGSSGAQPGTHDDRVMAMAIALAARTEVLPKRVVSVQ